MVDERKLNEGNLTDIGLTAGAFSFAANVYTMEEKFKNCQSCGMPLKKSPNGGGSCADGSISTMYCSHCFEHGAFKQPDWTVEQMKEFVREKMRNMGFPGFLARIFSGRIHKLKRWS